MKMSPTSAVQAIMLAKRIASKVDPGFASVDIPTFGHGAPVERSGGGYAGEGYAGGGYADGGEIDGIDADDEGKTIPETAKTLEHQRQLLLEGRRKAVMYPSGGNAAPEAPDGAGVTVTPDGTFHFNPALITEEQIHEASRQHRLNDVLGLGPYSKQDVAKRVMQGEHPVAVVARDHEGHEVVSAAGTHATADEQIEAMRHQVPEGGTIGVEHPEQVIRDRAAVHRASGGGVDDGDDFNPRAVMGDNMPPEVPQQAPQPPQVHTLIGGGQRRSVIDETSNPTRIKFNAQGPGGIKGIIVPRHMWEGGNGKYGSHIPGMEEVNQARAEVYGSDPRPPLNVGQIERIHKAALEEHFQKPVSQQIVDEKAALNRLRAAKHIGKSANTLDEGEKLDTVKHEYDDQGRSYVAYGAKGTAGHAVYTSGTGENEKFNVLNTCPGQTSGCGGGVDKNGVVDTRRGMCFAPKAEAQYAGAAVRRASHTQAKHDPAMTEDWILAHTGSLRDAARKADKTNNVVLFRPNVLDETDRSTRYVIKGLNEQRKADDLPPMIANSYGKTTELHDPENGYYITHSNIGPKTKLGASVAENIKRDRQRIRSTITAADASGKDFVNDEGKKTPPKNSYMVTDVARDSLMDKALQQAITHAKYWSTGRDESELSPSERKEGPTGHFDGSGRATTPEKAHYGHDTINGLRYDYQKQHILHPRYVKVGKNDDGSDHMIPTDSRFKDDDFLPANRFKTKNGKQAGAILLTTPTKSTSGIERQASFTHHIGQEQIAHAAKNKGEYEIDSPREQEAARGKEYQPPNNPAGNYARGGHVSYHQDPDIDSMAFPEQNFQIQRHNAHREIGDIRALGHERHAPVRKGIVNRALDIVEQIKKPSRT